MPKDFKEVEAEETLTPRQLGYTGDEDFSPETLRSSAGEEEIRDTHAPDDEGVETAVDDSQEM